MIAVAMVRAFGAWLDTLVKWRRKREMMEMGVRRALRQVMGSRVLMGGGRLRVVG